MFQLHLNFLASRLPSHSLRDIRPGETFLWKNNIKVRLVTQPKARRYLLRLQPNGSARLVIPRRGSKAEALRFLERSEAWLQQKVTEWQARSQRSTTWTEGARFLFRGEEACLCLDQSGHSPLLRFADQAIGLKHPQADYRLLVHKHLRRLAEHELPARTHELALAHGISVSRVLVRAQRSRWGSCSARGTISLNWRLIQAPTHVLDYLIIHELMHRREMNHSTRYWKLVATACPGYEAAEKWLKANRLEDLG